jgi:hypothetical protein
MQTQAHPSTNPDLPSFVDPDLAEVLPDLDLVYSLGAFTDV